MKKLILVIALGVSGFGVSQYNNSKLDSLFVYANYDTTYNVIQDDEYEYIFSLKADDAIKYEKLQAYVNTRYANILGDMYSIECVTIDTNSNDVWILIIDNEFFKPGNPDFCCSDKVGFFFTYLSNVEASFIHQILLNEIHDVFKLEKK